MLRWVRWTSAAAWIFCWRTIYLEVFRWQHLTKTLRFNPPPPAPGMSDPPKAGFPLIAVCVGSVAAPLAFLAATVAECRRTGRR